MMPAALTSFSEPTTWSIVSPFYLSLLKWLAASIGGLSLASLLVLALVSLHEREGRAVCRALILAVVLQA
jgi:hypothetical protein